MAESRSGKGASNRFERHPRLTLSMVLLVSIGMVLVGAEMIAQWAYPSPPSPEYRVPHPRFGWVLVPGASYINHIAGESVPVSYNAEGWRDRPHSKNKAPGVVRVLVLGDSFMEAAQVRFEDALPARLERLLSTAERPVEVINFGVSGYGTLQEYLVFNAFGHAYQPDVVVLAMYLRNDLNDNSQELSPIKTRPFLDPRVSAPGWRITPVDFDAAQQRYEEELRLRHSALLHALDRVSRRIWKKTRSSRVPTKFSKYYCSQPPEYGRAWGVTGRILTRLHRDVQEAGARLLVMSVPAVIEVDEDAMARHIRKAAKYSRRKSRRSDQDVLRGDRLCLEQPPAFRRLDTLRRELDIDYLDLLPAFRKARRQTGVELFLPDDEHWNPEGHALAARELAAALEHGRYLVSHGTYASSSKEPLDSSPPE